MGSQVGPGTLNLLYPAELFPAGLRASAVGFGTAISRIGSILGVLVFPTLVDSWGLDRALWLFVVVAALGLLVSILMAPETKGKTLEETSGDTHVAAGLARHGTKRSAPTTPHGVA